ncbi:hypothetical protein LJB80_01575 [Bacteroides sp. OttesenSCG-928-F21]|nr:hypothetical protein [Bacteroides sp. OttesenSCG-928-F21]
MYSKSIKQSKKVKAFIGECRIENIDTIIPGYEFPVERVWVEKSWKLGRNRLGMVCPVTLKSKRIIFDIYPDNSFFRHDNFTDEWVVKDSLTGSVGHSEGVMEIDFRYNPGDTIILKVYKLKEWNASIWREECLIPIYKFEAICDWGED